MLAGEGQLSLTDCPLCLVWRPEASVLNGWLTSQVPGAAPG